MAAYAGLIGSPSQRVLGATAIYLAVNSPFELSVCGAPRRTLWLAVVPPNQPHEISSPERVIRKILVEPESLADRSARDLPADDQTHRDVPRRSSRLDVPHDR